MTATLAEPDAALATGKPRPCEAVDTCLRQCQHPAAWETLLRCDPCDEEAPSDLCGRCLDIVTEGSAICGPETAHPLRVIAALPIGGGL